MSLIPAPASRCLDSGNIFWNEESFGADQEVYFTFTNVAAYVPRARTCCSKRAAWRQTAPSVRTATCSTSATTPRTEEIEVSTLSPGDVWATVETCGGIRLADGDLFGARAMAGGIVEIYHNEQLIGQVDLSAGELAWDQISEGGMIGVWFEAPSFAGRDGASFTDFGGGTLP